jgi:hypothetical protein
MVQQQMCRSNGAGVDGRVLHRSRGGYGDSTNKNWELFEEAKVGSYPLVI